MRKIKELDRGESVWIHEDGVETEFIVVQKNKNCVEILRKNTDVKRRMHSSNNATYDGCEMDLWLNDEETGYLSRFTPEVRNCFVANSISTFDFGDTEVHYIARRCYLPSHDNIFGNNTIENDVRWTYAIYLSSTGDTLVGLDGSGSAVNWWLRSPNSAANFTYVFTFGTINNSSATYTAHCPRPALSVSPDTIVSDEGAEKIYIFPDENKQYREIDAIGYVGQSNTRPAKAKVSVNAVNLFDVSVEVSNNAKDAEPVWVDATGGSIVELTNITKTSEQWEIAVRLKGKSNSNGYFNEPAIFVQGG